MWREDAVQALLEAEDATLLFVAGCEENQAKFHAQFDHIVLLSAPLETLVERMATRSNNSYGKSPLEFRRFLEDVETIEPLLRRVTTHEVQTTCHSKRSWRPFCVSSMREVARLGQCSGMFP
jgi:hypothetical protein